MNESGHLTDCAPTHLSTSDPSPVSQVEMSAPGSVIEDHDPERLDLKHSLVMPIRKPGICPGLLT